MSIEASIKTAMGTLAGGQLYPDYAPETAMVPYIVYRRVSREPLMTLDGPTGDVRSSYIFWCWAISPAAAQALSDDVAAAINAAAAITVKFEEPVTVDAFEPVIDEYAVPRQFGFWHT